MAAGIGSRYGGLKQVEPVGPSGENIIDYSVYDAIRAGFGKIVFVIRRDIEEIFREKVGRVVESRIETAYVYQELTHLPKGFTLPEGRTKPWGTGHAMLCAKNEVHTPSAVINADDFYGRSAYLSLSRWLSQIKEGGAVLPCCMIGYRLSNTLTEHGHVARGICTVDAGSMLTGVVERTKIKRFSDGVKYTEDDSHWTGVDAQSFVSMNMWGFTPAFFAETESQFTSFLAKNHENLKAEYYIPSVVNASLGAGKATVQVLPTAEKWFGVTYKEDRAQVVASISALIDNGEYPVSLWGAR
jgi:dTDP-glucose pyrophosphorylase